MTGAPASEFAEDDLSGSEIRSRALTGMLSLTMRSVFIRVLNLGGNIVLVRFLTPSDFGLLSFGLSVTAIGGFLASGGLGTGLIRQKHTPTRRQLEAVLGVQLVVTLAVVVLVALVGLTHGRAGAIAAVMVLTLPIDTLRSPAALLTERSLRYGPIIRGEVSEMIAYNAIALGLVVLGAGIWGVAAATVVRAAVGTVVLIASADTGWFTPRPRLAEVRPLYRFGLAFQGIGVVNLVRDQTSNFALLALGGTFTLGIVTLILRLLSPIALLFEASWRVSFPAVSRLIELGEDPSPTLTRALRLSTSITGLAVAGVVASMPALVPSLFGARWNATIPAMPWALGALLVAGPISVCASGYLAAIGRADILLRLTIIGAVVSLAISVPLIAPFGAAGAAAGGFAASLLGLVLFGARLKRLVGLPVARTVAPSLLATLTSGAAGWLAAASLRPTLPVAILAAAIAAAGYLGLLRLLQPSAISDQLALARRLARRPAPVPETA